jgi:hypothetical protein
MIAAPAPGRIGRAGWLAVGFAAVGVGAVGAGARTAHHRVLHRGAWCFSRSNPRFEQWVLDLPRVGTLVRDHRDGLGMPRRAKQAATATMVAAITVSSITLRDTPVLVGVVLALGLIGAATIWFRVPTREHVVAARSAR